MGYQNQSWLDQVIEPVVDPNQRICDPHHHLWDHPTHRYLLDEFLIDVNDGHRVEHTVFVECASMYRATGDEAFKPVGETEFVNGIAAMSASGNYGEPRIASAIVSFADLMSPQIERVLASHASASERFRGIRHAAGWHPDSAIRNSHSDPFEGMLSSPQFRRGFKILVDQGWSFDAWLYHSQIDELTDLASTFPEANIVLDHFGGPLGIGPYAGQATQVFENWKRSVSVLSQLENVKVKLGGLVMPVNGFGLHKRAQPPTSDELVALTRQYYLAAIEFFGVERCMFESNFPVDRQSCSYRVLWNAFKKLVQDFSTDERDQLFYRTAMETYRIDAKGSAV